MSDDTPTPHSSNGAIDWAAAVAAHRGWLRTVVYSRLGDSHAVDEVLQDVAVCAIQQQPVLTDRSKVPAWLYRVAVRQSLLHRRRLGRDKRRTQQFADRKQSETDGIHETSDPLRWLLADEERELVRSALESLKPRDRELLLLKYTENWTCRELAERLGIQVTAVETRLDRARQRLRRELARLDISEDNR